MEKRINKNTIMLVASAPNYPYGTIDPIIDIGRIALEYGIPLHVDACLGGFLLPFLEKLGYNIPPFDFRVPGVTSISADVHKYGYAAKGASVILYKNMKYLKHQFFVYADWPGGVFASSGLLGTRPGGAIAAAWAAMQVMGEEGYKEQARKAMTAAQRIKDGIAKIPELQVLGNPPATVLRFVSTDRDVDIFAIGDVMEKYGWHVDRQQKPESLHIMVTASHGRVAGYYLRDLQEAIEYVRNHPNAKYDGGAALYGMIATIPLRSMVRKNVLKMMEEMYGSQGLMPNFDEESGPDLSTRLGTAYLKVRNRLKEVLGKV
jgi:glutamate/tyrosine decarboxylase-like PLP-dependent enzyme